MEKELYLEEDEAVIDLGDMAAFLMHRWKKIIIVSIILMILMGGFMSYRDWQGLQNKYQDDTYQSMTQNMTDEQIETVNQFFNRYLTYKQRIANNQQYIDSSIRMKLDAANVSVSTREYLIKTDAQQVLQSFSEAALDLDDYKRMAEIIGTDADPRYVGELVDVSNATQQDAYDIDTDKVGDVINGSISKDYNGILTLRVIYDRKDICEKLTAVANDAIMTHYQKLKDAGVRLEIKELADTYTERVDQALFDYQQSMIETGANMVSSYYAFQTETEKSLDEDEIALFKYLIEKKEEVKDHVHWKKWMAIGFGAGFVLACICLLISYLMIPAIKTADDARRITRVDSLGMISQPPKAKAVAFRLIHDIANRVEFHGVIQLDESEAVSIISERIRKITENKNIDNITLIADAADEYSKDIGGRCLAALKERGLNVIAGNPSVSAEDIKALRETKGAVLMLTTKKSLPESIKRNISICEESSVPVIGNFIVHPQG